MSQQQSWVVTVDMGYGHQRAAHPLSFLSSDSKVIVANNYQGIPKKDFRLWNSTRKLYERISRLKSIPLIGDWIFNIMDSFQRIPNFYPRRDLSEPTLQLTTIYRYIRNGWGKDLINFLNEKDIPLITTFFTVAFFAEEHGFKNDIYCVICDTDLSRAWVPLRPEKSRIKYLASCRRAAERLKLYGVREENIFLTGFPLPLENIGDEQLDVLKGDLADRLNNLDPHHHYRQKYDSTVKQFLRETKPSKEKHPLTLTFAVGGAGAQRSLACEILRSLKKKLLDGEINLNLVAGSRNDVYLFFKDDIEKEGLEKLLGVNLNLLFAVEKNDYFNKFNECLRTTDILWTKPSELVFYSALGIPIIMAPTVGSQEDFNHQWITTIGAGLDQGNPAYTSEWLFDWIESGWLAEAAMSGFLDGRQFGVRNIVDVVFNGVKEPAKDYQLM